MFSYANHTKVIVGTPTIWILGSSIPFWAGHHAATQRPGGSNLNLPVLINWLGRRGMHWDQLDSVVSEHLLHLPPPKFLLIHLGSNDLTTPALTGIELVHRIQCSLYRYNVLLPNTTLIFSSMLPRLYWHGAPLTAGGKINSKRLKVNKAIKKFITQEVTGCYINHDTTIRVSETPLFRHDGTHLSKTGLDIYLNNLQSGIQLFLNNTSNIYPSE